LEILFGARPRWYPTVSLFPSGTNSSDRLIPNVVAK
jgi:hypothetical protein